MKSFFTLALLFSINTAFASDYTLNCNFKDNGKTYKVLSDFTVGGWFKTEAKFISFESQLNDRDLNCNLNGKFTNFYWDETLISNRSDGLTFDIYHEACQARTKVIIPNLTLEQLENAGAFSGNAVLDMVLIDRGSYDDSYWSYLFKGNCKITKK